MIFERMYKTPQEQIRGAPSFLPQTLEQIIVFCYDFAALLWSLPRNAQQHPNHRLVMFARVYKSVVGESLRFAIIAALIVIPFRLWVAQPFIVRGASMDPAFFDGEYLIIDEFSYHFRQPERGEVVVFRYPLDPQTFFIKRIIGLPGETVRIRNGQVFVGMGSARDELSESYLGGGRVTFPDMEMTLGAEEYFVMGDNRVSSLDSRRWGTLERRLITGRTLLRLWPPARAAVVSGE